MVVTRLFARFLPKNTPPNAHHARWIICSGITSDLASIRGIFGNRAMLAWATRTDHVLLGEMQSISNPPSRNEA